MKVVISIVFLCLSVFYASAQITSILVVTGGHDFEREPFEEMFNSMEGLKWEEVVQPKANRMIADEEVDEYDVLVFYDMFQPITEAEKEAYIKLLEDGKPMLFFHHALVSYQNWDEFEQIIGGRYYDEKRYPEKPDIGFSTYLHETEIGVELMNVNHPVVNGLNDFTLFDEVYGNTLVLPGVKPIIGTDHPQSKPIIGWENQYANSTIIYLQPGHGKSSFENENYRTLLYQSIQYLAEN